MYVFLMFCFEQLLNAPLDPTHIWLPAEHTLPHMYTQTHRSISKYTKSVTKTPAHERRADWLPRAERCDETLGCCDAVLVICCDAVSDLL